MAKYRGADGWLHDDSVEGPRRYENKENVKENAPAKKEPDPDVGPRSRCPNCDLSVSWRRLEGFCAACGWGKKESKSKDGETGACCAFLGLITVCPLVGAGMGYAALGFGGLLAGGGLGLALPIGLVVWAATSVSAKKEQTR